MYSDLNLTWGKTGWKSQYENKKELDTLRPPSWQRNSERTDFTKYPKSTLRKVLLNYQHTKSCSKLFWPINWVQMIWTAHEGIWTMWLLLSVCQFILTPTSTQWGRYFSQHHYSSFAGQSENREELSTSHKLEEPASTPTWWFSCRNWDLKFCIYARWRQ